jgi:hypothetical protein
MPSCHFTVSFITIQLSLHPIFSCWFVTAEGLEMVAREGAGHMKQHESGLAKALIPGLQLGTEGFSNNSSQFTSNSKPMARGPPAQQMMSLGYSTRYGPYWTTDGSSWGLWDSVCDSFWDSFWTSYWNRRSRPSWLPLGIACAAGVTAAVLLIRSNSRSK